VSVTNVITGSLSKNLGSIVGWNSIHNAEHKHCRNSVHLEKGAKLKMEK
jgi:hypothetical protein